MTMYGDYNRSKSYNDDTHILNFYKTMLNVIDADRQYGCRFHV